MFRFGLSWRKFSPVAVAMCRPRGGGAGAGAVAVAVAVAAPTSSTVPGNSTARCFFSSLIPSSSATTATATATATTTTPVAVAAPSLLDAFRDPVSRETRMREPVGRSWSVKELRRKSFDDLHKLWYVLYKENNMLLTEQQLSRRRSIMFPQPERMQKVKKSMGAIRQVLGERKREKIAAFQLERKQQHHHHHQQTQQQTQLQPQQQAEAGK